jgi:hypothetical protein
MAVQKNFTIRNGLEVNNNLIFADTNSNKVGIATTVVNYTLDVDGTIGAENSIVTGISTVNTLSIGGVVSLGNSSGSAGQYLVSTGTGVTWSSVPTVRSSDIQTAGVGATTFNTIYSVGLLDVYINGVKLSASEYTADDSATVVLDSACFGGETVEFISYSPFGIGIGGTSIQGITILDEGSPIGSALQVTSINFVGAAVTSTGSGVGVTVYVSSSGIATYADTAGISTYSSSAGISSYSDVAGISTYADTAGISTYSNVSGISTYSSSAGISTYADTAGISTYSNVAGISTYADTAGIATVSSGLTGTPDIEVGIVTASNGFTSGIGVTDPVQIQVSGNVLTFNVVGIGSTSLVLF